MNKKYLVKKTKKKKNITKTNKNLEVVINNTEYASIILTLEKAQTF
jgi:hypothetical protein